jgi:ABC-2 type transport system ATP-binding protein
MNMEIAEQKALTSSDLTKKYGDKSALNNVRIQVGKGSFYGLLGPNGAGKSTLMKLVVGALQPTKGSIEVFGQPAGKGKEVRKGVGYVPQDIALYDTINAKQNLQFFGSMYGMKGRNLDKRIEEVLEFVGLTEKTKDQVKTFSGGMKRRLNVAAAILHRPQLLLLDEATVGVDPQSRNRMFEMFRHLREEGTTIVYSSHYMEEVEELCDTVGIIDHGSLIEQDRLSDLLAKYAGTEVYIEFPPGPRVESEWLHAAYPQVQNVRQNGDGWIAEANDRMELMAALLESAKSKGIVLRRLEIVKPSLEAVFLKLTGVSLRDK